MASRFDSLGMPGTVLWFIVDIVFFWWLRLWNYFTTPSRRDALLSHLAHAHTFEEWESTAKDLDQLLDYTSWQQNPSSPYYSSHLLTTHLSALQTHLTSTSILPLTSHLRSGLIRNLANITSPQLYTVAYAGTKLLIDDYIVHVAASIRYLTSYPTAPEHPDSPLSNQAKLDTLHDTRQAFGRSALVLQGGAIFGLCHLGVVKALHLRGLLPRIIVGTATGALIAALVGTHTEDELLGFLTAEGIDLTAFAKKAGTATGSGAGREESGQADGMLETVFRRVRRFFREGYLLDIGVLEKCVRANVGDLTFEEAYGKTKKVLNITVSTTAGGVPSLLNYLTAPNVLIWSAALASNASASALFSPVTLMCKDEYGNIVPWVSAQEATFQPWTHASYTEKDSPLHRIAELFNVNHFIVSQARPYVAPFLRSDLHHHNPRSNAKWNLTMPILRLVVMEIQHRLHQLDSLRLLSPTIRRFLIDEDVPGMTLTLVPELTPGDFAKLLENPTKKSVDYWILRGERSVWPAVAALKVRCAIEVELDQGYQLVRRRKPFDLDGEKAAKRKSSNGAKKRSRATSVGAG